MNPANPTMKLTLVFLALFTPLWLHAQNATLQGSVADDTGAVIPGATVTVQGPSGARKSTTAGPDGSYTINGLAPGAYTVTAASPAMKMNQPAHVTLQGGTQKLNLQLSVAAVTQQVTVQANTGPVVSLEPTNNASALTITGEDLQALPDDPDDLQADLQALAGPGAGPNGGELMIDGFSSGQIPPKDSIREIRINQNPFAPEYDRLGFGRIEIFTKPGTDKLRGNVWFNYGDGIWNSRNPYAQQKAPFMLQEWGGDLSGPLGKKASYTLDVERRLINNGAIVNAVVLDPSLQITPFTSTPVAQPRRIRITPRLDYQLTSNNTLTLRYAYLENSIRNTGIGNFNLQSLGYNSTDKEQTVQMIDSIAVNVHTINETRFQFYQTNTQNVANNGGPEISVLGSFNTGGNPLGRSLSLSQNYELQNYTTYVNQAHSFKFGVRLRGATIDDTSPSNFNGTFTFGGGVAPELDADNQPVLDSSGQPVTINLTSIQQYQRTLLFQNLGYSAAQIRALGGGPSQFSLSAGNPTLSVNQVDVGAFAGDDWKVKPNLTLSLGLRYETQTNIHDYHDFAPRIALAWAPGSKKMSLHPSTVIRAGFGIFYDRFAMGNTLTLERYNGQVQQQYYIANPDFYPMVPSPAALLALGGTQQSQSTNWEIDRHLRAPEMLQSSLSVEHQLPHGSTLSVTYVNSHGLHQLWSRDINAPLPGTYSAANPPAAVYPLGKPAPVFLMTSSGLYNQNQIITNINSRLNTNVSLFGFYTLNYANANTDGIGSFPANPYNYAGEYGPATTDVRHRMFIGGSINSHWNIRLSPFIMIQSGAPYNITIGRDLFGTTMFNARPGIATDLSLPDLVASPYGMLDPNPAPGEAILGRNAGRGPGQVTINARLSKTFGFGPETGGAPGAGATPGGPGGGGGHGHGGGPGGPGGGMRGMFSDVPTNHRYNLTISISARNLLNHLNPGPVTGNITSPLFGESNQIAGGFGAFAETANNRRMELQMRLTF